MPLKLWSTVLKACLGVMVGASLVSAREIHVATTGDDAAPGAARGSAT